MYGNVGHLLLKGNLQLAWLNIQAIDKSDTLTLKHHTEKAIKSFSDDMQWEFIIYFYKCMSTF